MAELSEPTVISPVLIGRQSSLALIDRSMDYACQGKGQVVLISGEAGIGKTRLLAESKTRAAKLGMLTLQGNCFESDISLPYAPLVDLLRSQIATLSPDEAKRLMGTDKATFAKLLPELFPDSPDLSSPSEPEQDKRRLFHALDQFLTRLNALNKSPLQIIVEDVHWADVATFEFLIFLVRHIHRQPTLLVLTFRSDEARPDLVHFLAELDHERIANEIQLAPLTHDQVGDMLNAMIDLPKPARAELLNLIYPLAEGNPFFIEEIVKSLIVSGELINAYGIWTRRVTDGLQIPRSIQDAVQRRIERLGEDTRQTLTLAAVAGQRFDFALLQAITGTNETGLIRQIKELIAAQLVVEESDDVFAFRHALTREAVRGSLLKRERKNYHRTIAETLERIYAQSLDAHIADLAYHFHHAQVWEKTIEYSRRAGERAQSLYAPRQAIDHFTRVIQACEQLALPAPLDTHRARGRACETLGDFDCARADYERVLDATQDHAVQWQSLIDLGLLWAGRDYARAGKYLQRALDLAREMNAPSKLARSLNRVGNWHLNNEQLSKALHSHQEALAIFKTSNDRPGLAETYDLLGMASYLSNDLLGGTEYLHQAVALFQEIDDRHGLASSMTALSLRSGATYQTSTMVTAPTTLMETSQDCERALKIARETGWRAGESFALWNDSHCAGPHGDYARALEHAQRAIEIADEIAHQQWACGARAALGAIYIDIFAYVQAAPVLERALELGKAIGSPHWLRTSSGFLASLYISKNEFDRAEKILDAAIPTGTSTQTLGQRLAYSARVELELARGEPQRALEIIKCLNASAKNLSANNAILRLSKLTGDALAMLGRSNEAEKAYRAAELVAVRQGAQSALWRIHAALGKLYADESQSAKVQKEFAAAREIIDELTTHIPSDLQDGFLSGVAQFIPSISSGPRSVGKEKIGGLTARERQVATLVAQGKSNREIADELVISERTTETHVGNILSKLGFSSRIQIATWATEQGFTKETPSN